MRLDSGQVTFDIVEIRLESMGLNAVSAIKDEGKVRVEMITVILSPAAVHRFVRWPLVAVIDFTMLIRQLSSTLGPCSARAYIRQVPVSVEVVSSDDS